jgi:hypothetical protein
MRRKIPSSSHHPFNYLTLAIVAAAMISGVAIGIGFSATVVSNPQNVASSQYIDTKAPDAQVCVQYGASAVALDARFFVTFNPFSVYVSQSKMQPGCVLSLLNFISV